MKVNGLSALGRMTYGMHMMMYPLIGIPSWMGYKAFSDYSAANAKAEADK